MQRTTPMTITVVPIADLMPVIDDLRREIRDLRDKLDKKPDETVLSDSEAARRLKISKPTLGRWKRDKKIGSVSTPRGRMCRVCDIEDYIK